MKCAGGGDVIFHFFNVLHLPFSDPTHFQILSFPPIHHSLDMYTVMVWRIISLTKCSSFERNNKIVC